MSSSIYTPWVVTVGEQPTTAYWNILGSNDASFNTGVGFNDNIILWRHLSNDIISTGTIHAFAGASAPSALWLICDGSAISRTTFAALFAVCGTSYGAGDGSTTFNIPNLAGRVAVGVTSGDANFSTIGQMGGEDAHTLSQAELPYYQLGVSDPGHSHSGGALYFQDAGGAGNLNMTGGGNGFARGQAPLYINGSGANISVYSNGSNQAHNNLQPYTTVNYIIKT